MSDDFQELIEEIEAEARPKAPPPRPSFVTYVANSPSRPNAWRLRIRSPAIIPSAAATSGRKSSQRPSHPIPRVAAAEGWAQARRSAIAPRSCRASCAVSSFRGSIESSRAPSRRLQTEAKLRQRPPVEHRGPTRAGDGRAAPRRAPARRRSRRPPRASRIHHQGAGGEPARSHEGESMGSRRSGDRDLPPAAPHQGPPTGRLGASESGRSNSELSCAESTNLSGCSGWGGVRRTSGSLVAGSESRDRALSPGVRSTAFRRRCFSRKGGVARAAGPRALGRRSRHDEAPSSPVMATCAPQVGHAFSS